MPTDLPKNLTSALWAIFEADTQTGGVANIVSAGNFVKQDATGWLKQMIANPPADWRQISINGDQDQGTQRITHSMHSEPNTFVQDGAPHLMDYINAGTIVRRSTDLIITIREEVQDAATDETSLMEAVLTCLVKNPGLGLSVDGSFACRVNPITNGTRRFTRESERPYPGRITILPLTIETVQTLASIVS